MPTHALSVRAPWWWAILHAGKDVENRSRRNGFRGRVWLHASAWHRPTAIAIDMGSMADVYDHTPWQTRDPRHNRVRDFNIDKHEALRDLKTAGGHIVGSVEVVDCVTASASPWFCGPVGFVLRDPVVLSRPIPCKGALGFFRVPASVLADFEATEAI
ncbi:MAG: hypothetical protein J0H82_26390 [Alphaproteobacteria bacterium]|nr:hypothetical protein [Alphaproteobacteria bacterium]